MSAMQYGKWGVGGCVTRRPTSSSLRAQLHTVNISLRSATAQSIGLIFTCTEGKPTVLQLCCKTSANWGRWRGNCIADGCCVSWALNSLLTFWACYQLYMLFFMSERTWAYGLLVYIIFNLVVNMTDTVWKQISAFKSHHTLPFSPSGGVRAC